MAFFNQVNAQTMSYNQTSTRDRLVTNWLGQMWRFPTTFYLRDGTAFKVEQETIWLQVHH